jgi:hypothetical protein
MSGGGAGRVRRSESGPEGAAARSGGGSGRCRGSGGLRSGPNRAWESGLPGIVRGSWPGSGSTRGSGSDPEGAVARSGGGAGRVRGSGQAEGAGQCLESGMPGSTRGPWPGSGWARGGQDRVRREWRRGPEEDRAGPEGGEIGSGEGKGRLWLRRVLELRGGIGSPEASAVSWRSRPSHGVSPQFPSVAPRGSLPGVSPESRLTGRGPHGRNPRKRRAAWIPGPGPPRRARQKDLQRGGRSGIFVTAANAAPKLSPPKRRPSP